MADDIDTEAAILAQHAQAAPWVPDEEELERMARIWVVRNRTCGHVSIVGRREECAQALAHLEHSGWELIQGATPMDLEHVARSSVCRWCAQPQSQDSSKDVNA